jgi:hypothetical protein
MVRGVVAQAAVACDNERGAVKHQRTSAKHCGSTKQQPRNNQYAG